MTRIVQRFAASVLFFSTLTSLIILARYSLPLPSPESMGSRRDFYYYDNNHNVLAVERERNQTVTSSQFSGQDQVGDSNRLVVPNYKELADSLKRDVQSQRKALKEYADLIRNLREVIYQGNTGRTRNETTKTPNASDEHTNTTVGGSPTTNLPDRPGASSLSSVENNRNILGALLADNYLGCYADSFEDRDLPVHFPSFTAKPARCIATCRSNGYKFAGLQDGGECWCGNDAPRHEKLVDSRCNKQCSGDMLNVCGGALKNSVYRAADLGFEDADLVDARPFNIQLAGSSVICQGHNAHTRVCKFRNLYYDTSVSQQNRGRTFLFYRGPGTIVVNIDDIKNAKSGDTLRGLLDFTSITGIFGMDLIVVDVPPPGAPVPENQQKYLDYDDVHVVRGVSALFARFLPYNIMHVIHDDLLNLFMTLVEYTGPFYDPSAPPVFDYDGKNSTGVNHAGNVTQPSAMFDSRTRLVVVDGHGAGSYITMTQYLSDLPVTHVTEIVNSSQALARQVARPASKGNLVRFETAIAGITRHCNWYQYGFQIPQGPIEGKEVDGFNVRMFTDHILQRIPSLLRLPASVPLRVDPRDAEGAPVPLPPKPDEGELLSDQTERYVVIFSRTFNRRILNEPELADALRNAYPHLKLVIIRLEETPLPTIIRVLEKTHIAVGMHGSILILSMFMPKNSLLAELFPYAVPAENYTPYKTMSNLKNMGIKYASWMNSHIENNVAFPNRTRLHGGLSHLPKNEQDEILNRRWVPEHTCCENPYWLFRIYQDTKVHIPELMEIIESRQPL